MATVNIEDRGTQIVIQLQRSEKRNAMNMEMIEELTAAFHQVSTYKAARVVQLCGAGKSFSAGADLKWMKSMVNFTEDQNRADSLKLHQMFVALEKIQWPVIANVQGHVMGGALGLVALCDYVIAEENTKFSFSEVRLGLSPAVVSEFVAKKIPRSWLQALFLTAKVFDAHHAQNIGLVHEVVPFDKLDPCAENLCRDLLKLGPKALKATKSLLSSMEDRSREEQLKYNVDLISSLRVSPEGQEGLGAFFEKRAPRWSDRG